MISAGDKLGNRPMAGIKFHELGESDDAIVRFLDLIDNSMIYYSPRYLAAVAGNIDASRAGYLVADEGGKISGILPIVEKTVPSVGTVINSLPYYGSHGGVLTAGDGQEKTAASLWERFVDYAENRGAFSVTVITNPFAAGWNSDELKKLGFTLIDERTSQSRSLQTSGADLRDDLLDSFHQKARNSVRKGLKTGLEVREDASDAAIEWVHSVHEESISSMGGIAKKLSDFHRFRDHLKDGFRCFLGSVDGVDCCGLVILSYRGTIEYFTPVSTQPFRNHQVLPALILEVMALLSAEGNQLWNWGGTWKSQSGVYRFKDRLGSVPRPYFYFNRYSEREQDHLSPEECLLHFPGFYVRRFS